MYGWEKGKMQDEIYQYAFGKYSNCESSMRGFKLFVYVMDFYKNDYINK